MNKRIATLAGLLSGLALIGFAAGAQEIETTNLQGLVVFPTQAQADDFGNHETVGPPVRIIGPAWVDAASVRKIIAPYLGKPLSEGMLKGIETNMVLMCRRKGHPVVDVYWPEAPVTYGFLPLGVIEGVLGKVVVTNNDWHSSKWIIKRMGLRTNAPITAAELNRGLTRLNENPDFLQSKATFVQGQNLGEANVRLDVTDRFPIRPHFGVDDAAAAIFGNDRIRAGATWGNVFGLNQTLDYDYAADLNFKLIKSHTGAYVIPLPWGDSINLMGNYSYLNPDLSKIGLATATAQSTYWQAGLRYNAPLPSIGVFKQTVSAGFDQKSTDSTVLFGGQAIPNGHSPFDVDEFAFTYRASLPDRFGQTSAEADAYYSPGHNFSLGTHDNDAAFSATRTNAVAEFHYEVLKGERVFDLPGGFSLVSDATWQFTGQRLPYSEELAIGGYATVRGFDERQTGALGDQGLILRNELRSPMITLARYDGGFAGLQILGFFDYGSFSENNPFSGSDTVNHAYLSSAGPGVRFEVSKHVAIRVDYGFKLHSDPTLNGTAGASASHGRGHFALDIAF